MTFEECLRRAATVRYHGISNELAEFLFHSAAEVPAGKHIVEIGSFVGYSTHFLAGGAQQGNRARVHCIDPWGLPPSSKYSRDAYGLNLDIDNSVQEEFRENLKHSGLYDFITEHRAYGHEECIKWTYGEQSVGLIFIDGDHSEWGAFMDFYNWRSLLAKDAYVIWHDFGFTPVTLACMHLNSECMDQVVVVGAGYRGREALAFRYVPKSFTTGERRWKITLNALHALESVSAGKALAKGIYLARALLRRMTGSRHRRFPD